MHPELNDLATVIEEEIAVGEELRRNLAAQRQALVVWDMEVLIAGIEARAPWLRSLAALEGRRLHMLNHDGAADGHVTLNRLIAACPAGAPERDRLQSARARARETFSRLQADEANFNGLMENLLAHLRHALTPLAHPAVPLYGDTGTAAPPRPSSALLRNKA